MQPCAVCQASPSVRTAAQTQDSAWERAVGRPEDGAPEPSLVVVIEHHNLLAGDRRVVLDQVDELVTA